MDPKEAGRAALRLLGGPEQIKEECREMRNGNFVENFLQDIGFGFGYCGVVRAFLRWRSFA